MKLTMEDIVVRPAKISDAQDIVQLFSENGTNPYGWSAQKWNHYYVEYPDGEPVSIVAEIRGVIVGHYGMVPVMIGEWPAMLGLHAYVSLQYRGLTIISALMAEVDRICVSRGVSLICGFANIGFSLIKKTFFKWTVPLWLGFKRGVFLEDVVCGMTRFQFRYSDTWYLWRFGEYRDYYLSRYVDADGGTRKQLLKVRGAIGDMSCLADCECWSRKMVFRKEQSDRFCQPFSVKVYDRSLLDLGVLVPEKWCIDMGDSDTFAYTPWDNHND